MRRGLGLLASLTVLVLAGLQPVQAEPASDRKAPWDGSGDELTCGAPAEFAGSPYLGVPVLLAPPSDGSVSCASKRSALRSGPFDVRLEVTGTGTVAEGTYSHASGWFMVRHRLNKPADHVRYEMTFVVDDAALEIPIERQTSTYGFVMLQAVATHSACERCRNAAFLTIVDSDPSTTAPDRLGRSEHTLVVDMTNPDGQVPKGFLTVVPIVAPIMITGSFVNPATVGGSAIARGRLTRIIQKLL